MNPSVESICNTLSRSRLLPRQEVDALLQRWAQSAGSASQDAQKFVRWLVANRTLTGYQMNVLQRGHADQLFLGPYKILERITRGRLAGLYQAVHSTGAVVALEVLPPSQARNPKSLARFQARVRLALRPAHPNLARTFQLGEVKKLHYRVSEYLEGETLDDLLRRRGQLSPAEVVRLGHQALLGLRHLQQHGLVHRAIQPGNLLLAGGQEKTALTATLKILDAETTRFLPGKRPGSERSGANDPAPHRYMSPEQLRDTRTSDLRSDLYSLGGVLYHGLTGRSPFGEVEAARAATESPCPPRQIDPAIPAGLEQVVLRLLAREPAQRYSDPAEVDQALLTFPLLGPEPVPLERDPKVAAYLGWLTAQTAAGSGAVEAREVDSARDQRASRAEEPEFFEGPIEVLEEGERKSVEKGEQPLDEEPNPWAHLED
jgi:serine/threonine protein kinase